MAMAAVSRIAAFVVVVFTLKVFGEDGTPPSIVQWVEEQQKNGMPNATIVAALRTNTEFDVESMWCDCFTFDFSTNNFSKTVSDYEKRINVSLCLVPFCGLSDNPAVYSAYTNFCDGAAMLIFGTQGEEFSKWRETNANNIAKFRRAFLDFMRKGPKFRKPLSANTTP